MLLTELPPPYGGLSVHSERLRAMLGCGGGNGFLPDRLEGSLSLSASARPGSIGDTRARS